MALGQHSQCVNSNKWAYEMLVMFLVYNSRFNDVLFCLQMMLYYVGAIFMGVLDFIFLRPESSLGSGTVKVFVLDENVPGLRTGLDGSLGSEPFPSYGQVQLSVFF